MPGYEGARAEATAGERDRLLAERDELRNIHRRQKGRQVGGEVCNRVGIRHCCHVTTRHSLHQCPSRS